jgi:hypothetical protein
LFKEKELPLALILNHSVGEHLNGSTVDKELALISNSIIPAIIIEKSANNIMTALSEELKSRNNILSVFLNRDRLNIYTGIYSHNQPRFTLFRNDRVINEAIKENKVIFEDKFNKLHKDADYLEQDDEFFSEDHIYYKKKWI